MEVNCTMKQIKYLILSVIIFVLSTFNATQAKSDHTRQIGCLAEAGYFEARGDGERGMLATMFVILNRTKDGRFPDSPCAVIAQPKQFSYRTSHRRVTEPELHSKALQLASDVLSGKSQDITNGSLYFNSLHRPPTKGAKCTMRIKGHSFYK